MTGTTSRVGIAFNAHEPAANRSSETISETSVQLVAAEVCQALATAGYQAILLPVQSSLPELAAQVQEQQIALLVNLCEAFRGVPQLEFHVAAFFETMGWAYTGSGPFTLALCQQKFASKALLQAHGLPCPRGALLQAAAPLPDLRYPVIVKPNAEDASLGIYADSVVSTPGRLGGQVERILADYRQPALVEEYIEGREFNVALLDDGGQVRALPVSEISFAGMPAGAPHILGYEAKWFEEHPLYHATVPVCPARISASLQQQLQTLAVAAFKAMGCRDYARVDFRVDAASAAWILEVNPNPDIGLGAGYCRALTAAGISYPDFWRIMLNNASRRRPQ